jgi:translation initiation factor 2 alpha subunit (eIF-2alpha)
MKMVEINKNDLSIETGERLTWENDVERIYDDIRWDIEYEYENNKEEYDDDVLEGMKKFLDNELTKENKIEILEKIKDDYEYHASRYDWEVSIFDEDGIIKSIKDWIRDNFDFEV